MEMICLGQGGLGSPSASSSCLCIQRIINVFVKHRGMHKLCSYSYILLNNYKLMKLWPLLSSLNTLIGHLAKYTLIWPFSKVLKHDIIPRLEKDSGFA